MTQESGPFRLRSFLLGVFGFAIAAAAFGAIVFMWPKLAAFGSTDATGPVSSASTGSLETAQVQQIAAMQVVIDHLKYLLGGLALGLTGIVVIQTAFQARHDRVQHQGVEQVSNVMGVVKETLEARLKQDEAQQSGVQQVSEVMAVVRATLQTRLDAEIAARQRADMLQATIDEIKRDLDAATRRAKVQDDIIARERQDIEAKANQLATSTSRHEFRGRVGELNELAQKFDNFVSQSQPMEIPAQEFSARVLYIRGIAAHYSNDPERALTYLTKVTELTGGAEPPRSINRRIANAFYYLGITHSNFDNVAAARDSFSAAIAKFPEGGDYLTRVVFAEAIAMGGQIPASHADRKLTDPMQIVHDMADQFAQRTVPAAEHRLRSRAYLIQANIAILTGDRATIGDTVDSLLRPLLADDPDYYYASMTLAQARLLVQAPDAADIFSRAYDAILKSNHIFTVTEARSKILLHMGAALCLRHGMNDLRHSEEHLDAAAALLRALPKIGSESCTVFSVLTKRNEHSPTINQHIRDIRTGEYLIPGHLASP